MNKHKYQMAERFLAHALEIIYLLTGEEYTIVKKSPPHSSIPQLTGEVPIKCDDVAVYFSMEEWEYIEEHKELYKDIMMDGHQNVDIPVNSSPGLSGLQDENYLKAVSVNEEEEDTREESDAKPTEDLCVRSQLEAPEQEIIDIISTDGLIAKNILEVHQISLRSPDCVPEDFNVSQGCLETNLISTNTPSKNLNTSIVPQKTTHTGIQSCTFSDCGNGFTSNKVHVKHQKVENSFVCFVCGKCFPNKAKLIKHKRVHTMEKPFVCSECGKCFAMNSNLVCHKRVHTGEKPFACSECGKSFNLKGNLVRHQKHHTGVKSFTCSECGKCFVCKSYLVRHRLVHTEERPYACAECGKCFTRDSNLVKHKQVHTGERPFACTQCDKCFISKSNLVQHKRVHTGEKPYACSECGKCFAMSSNLLQHKRVHTGERPFVCSECGKSFKHKGNLVKHRRVHTG